MHSEWAQKQGFLTTTSVASAGAQGTNPLNITHSPTTNQADLKMNEQ